MLESASRGRLSIHHADIMKFYIPDALPKADAVHWHTGSLLRVEIHAYCQNTLGFLNIIILMRVVQLKKIVGRERS